MSTEDDHFDSLLGGTEKLPSSLSLAKFVAHRSQEIQIMKNSLMAQSGSKLAFQTIPKHMRRRAMSHNVKRLPRRLRQIHLNQMRKSGMPVKQKRPSRKYRRRPKNLIQEHTKRACKKYRWLQTHIWHAKRFHMVEKWGYKLPHHPCDKAFRACYRAMSKHCLLQDVSYYRCIEIDGDQSLIVEKLKPSSTLQSGLSIGARAFIQGKREGELVFYETEDKSYKRAIGTVNFQWRPRQNSTNVSKLWLWVHAAFYDGVRKMLNKRFEGLAEVKLSEIGTELCRFRLTGPLSNSVLHDTFKMLDIENTAALPLSLKEYILSPGNKQIIMDQYKCWDAMKYGESTCAIAPHSVLSLIVKDPRLNFPKKRIKSVSEIKQSHFVDFPENISQNPLWDDKLRREMNENRIPDRLIANMQSKLLIPGSVLEIETLIPIILIQRPGNRKENIGWGGGWDVILPTAWAKTFWVAFVMRGARAGGLRESDSMSFELGRQQLLQPDTKAGSAEEYKVFKEKTEGFFKKPPNKRINYNKFRIASPFNYNWNILLQEWSGNTSHVSVLRDRNILYEIALFLKSETKVIPQYPKNCLIPVKLDCVKRGSPLQFAIICLPKSQRDFKATVMEPIHVDELQKQRKELRHTHQTLMKKFRRQRKMKINSFKLEVYKEELQNFTKKMRALWLPEPTTIRYSCSKEVMGFVTKGGFSFCYGKGCGIGYIASDCLPDLVKFRNRILFRNTNSRQYKEAKLSVIVE